MRYKVTSQVIPVKRNVGLPGFVVLGLKEGVRKFEVSAYPVFICLQKMAFFGFTLRNRAKIASAFLA
jgi:hypothetical protein